MKMNIPIYPGDILFLPSAKLSAGGRVYFLGEINEPGAWPLSVTGDSTLARTILQRGGLTKFSDGSSVKVQRKAPDGSQQTLVFDVSNILKTGQFDNDIPLQDEDVIIVPAKIFSLF
jgi:protein involved in polysaccharide export with SLBB domain